jgi:hypothetical protein
MKKSVKSISLAVIMSVSMLFVGLGPINTDSLEVEIAEPNASGFGVQAGDELYYRSIEKKANDDKANETIEKWVIGAVTTDSISLTKYSASKENGFTFTFREALYEKYNVTQIWKHQIFPNNITNMITANQTDNFPMRYQAENGAWPSVQQYSDGSSVFNDMHMSGTGSKGLLNVSAVVNKTTGIMLSMFYGNESDYNTLELIKYDCSAYTMGQIDVFGYKIGDEHIIYRPAMKDEENKDGPSSADDNDDKYKVDEWVKIKVTALYTNPLTKEDVVWGNVSVYRDPKLTILNRTEPWRILGRIPTNNSNGMGEGWFNKEIDVNAVKDQIKSNIEDYENWTNVGVTASGENVFITGTTQEGLDGLFEITVLDGYGTTQFTRKTVYNKTSKKYEKIEMDIMVDGPGVKKSHATIGVAIGDAWETIEQSESEKEEWSPTEKKQDSHNDVVYREYRVTHICGINGTGMAVFGEVKKWYSHNPSRIMENQFQPFLVFDTAKPETFITMGGHGNLDGPPVLLPKVADWNTKKTAMIGEINRQLSREGETVLKSHFEASSIRLKIGESGSNDNDNQTTIVLEVNSDGLTTYLHYEEHRKEDFGDHGYRKREISDMFVIKAKTCANTTGLASVTNVSKNNVFVWEHSRYRPQDGEWGDPKKKQQDKIIVRDILVSCGGNIVFVGEQSHKQWNETAFNNRTWQLGEQPNEININYWVLGTIKDNDVWSWFQSQIFDIGITNFSTVSTKIIDMLNFGIDLPDGVVITTNNVTFAGRSFKVSLNMNDGNTHIMRFAASKEGIMQDMLMGVKYANGTWKEWERTVLAEAPANFDKGEVFTEDIPDNYESANTADTTDAGDSPFGNLPGYPVSFTILFSLIGVAMIVLKKKKH